MLGKFKAAFTAGQTGYRSARARQMSTVACAAIIVAAVSSRFSIVWYGVAVLEVVLVLTPAIILMRMSKRGNSR